MLDHPAAGWRIRAYEDRDRANCRAVFDACVVEFEWLTRGQPAPQKFRSGSSGLRTLVAEVEPAGAVGFIMFSLPAGYVHYLLVDPDWRLCGIGRGLLDVARETAGGPLYLDTDAENTRARAAYQAFGFTETSTRPAEGRSLVRLVGP